jgi:hypothetical protein
VLFPVFQSVRTLTEGAAMHATKIRILSPQFAGAACVAAGGCLQRFVL